MATRPLRCNAFTVEAGVSNMSTSNTCARTDRSTFPWSCHCHDVRSSGRQHPSHGTGFGSCRPALAADAVATIVARTTRDAATRRPRLTRSRVGLAGDSRVHHRRPPGGRVPRPDGEGGAPGEPTGEARAGREPVPVADPSRRLGAPHAG